MLRLLRYQKRAPSIAVTSASNAVFMGPSDLLSWARASPRPSASLVITHPIPADVLKEPSVQAWTASSGFVGGALTSHCFSTS
jgi:hypothetical protein